MDNKQFHEIANIFPMMQDGEYEELKKDIAQNGLREPIWLHTDGRIIDGRNRYRACLETGTQAHYNQWNGKGSLLSLVVSLNLHRRHLTSSQRAAISLEVLPILETEAKERQRQSDGRGQKGSQVFDYLNEGKAAEQAATLFDTNRQYVADAKKLRESEPELFEQVIGGMVSIPEAKRIADHQRINQSSNNEWYTPEKYIRAVHAVMNGVDTDPASNELANKTIAARIFYTAETDGFSKPWRGRVFLNPPYGRNDEDNESNQARWSRRLIEQYKAGVTSEAVLLVNAVPGNRWFAPLWEFPICFVDHRIRFYNEDVEAGQPTHSNAFIYLGNNIDTFAAVFSAFGIVAVKYEPN